MGEIKEASKRGEWYTVKGRASNGRDISVDVPANYIDGKSSTEGRRVMEKAIERMKDHRD